MSDNDCSIKELWCLQRAKTDPTNRGNGSPKPNAGRDSRGHSVRGDFRKGLSSRQCTRGQ